MSNWIHLKRTDPTVDRIVRAAFPHYTGRNVVADVTDTTTFYGTMWDEGNRRTYVLLRLADMTHATIPQEQFMQHSPEHHTPYKIPDGFVVVVWVQSRWEHILIQSPACNITPLLPPPTDLTEDERTVLVATCRYKSSYGGVKDYRFQEARRARGITRERYDAAKAVLISKGLLNKAGAVTVDGRNLVGDERL